MATTDLITNGRARVALPSAAASGADNTAINSLITACSKAITQFCRRGFASTAYDEVYNGTGRRQLILRNYPIVSVQSVRYRQTTVFKVQNTNTATNQQARASVTSTGITLVRVASGVSSSSSLAFGSYATLTALGQAVNALGNGWSATVTPGYELWPSADLYPPIQGGLNAAGTYAELRLHTSELAGFHVDERRGWLVRAIPYSDPELPLQSDDLIWSVGVNNFRVQYTAGYAEIPEDVQEACALLVAYHFKLGPRESLNVTIPPEIARLLGTYKDYKIRSPGG